MKKNAFFKATIDLTQPETHRVRVKIEKMNENLPGVLVFPVWTPGSYLVREYSRHITRLSPGRKLAKNRWEIDAGATSVNYEVYCFERTVRTSFVDENYAVLIGATLLPLLHGPFEVELRVPPHWKLVSSALNFRSLGKGRWVAYARDDDHWIDCPIVAAAPGFGDTGKFTLNGIPHLIAWVGPSCGRSMREMEEAFLKIAKATTQMFGGAPFKKYWFLLQFGHKLYGGLEHRDSQLSQFDGFALHEEKQWDMFLRLIAHEYIHSWNVKSIRPRALGPFDYQGENYTQDIWFAEGITDYIDDIIPLRAGLITPEAYQRARLSDANKQPDGLPAHGRRSLAETSFDAWIRHYRPDEDTVNSDVTYYAKGALLGWCWDAHLHKNSRGKWDLPKLMKAIWKEFGIDAYEPLASAKPGFTREELLDFAEEVTGLAQKKLVDGWVTQRKPLPWREAARHFRVPFAEKITDPTLHHLGISVQWKGASASVQRVISEGAAEAAGISPNDEILAVGDTRVTDAEKFLLTLKMSMAAGKDLDLLVGRLDKVFRRTLRWKKHSGLGVEYSLI